MRRIAVLILLITLCACGRAAADAPPLMIDTQEQKWQDVPGVKGAQWIPLREEPTTGRQQALVRFAEGTVEAPHHHTHGHWIYVLDGAKKVENLTQKTTYVLSNGMYLYTPAGDVHRITYLSRCTFLFVTEGKFDMIWDKNLTNP